MKFLLSLFLLFSAPLSWEVETVDYTRTYQEFLASAEANEKIDAENLNKPLLQAAIFYATNEYRALKRKPLFIYNKVLETSAQMHSSNMLENDFFSHTDKENKALKTPILRIRKSGGTDFTSVSENLIYSNVFVLGKQGAFFIKNKTLVDKQGKPLVTYTYAALARQMVADWNNSTGHRANLKGDFNFLGCGVSEIKTLKNGLKVVYATQNFGSK